jgi:hypothetical protein
MPSKHEIELFISDDGELKVHIKGMKGPGCLNILDALVKEVGIEKSRQLTGEYYAAADNKAQNSIKTKK